MNRIKGVSLIEAMAVILIGGLITVFAIPSFMGVVHNYRVTAYADALGQHLDFARSEAIKRNSVVNVCARQSPSSQQCGTINNWSNGWMVYYADSSGNPVVLKLQEALNVGSLVDFSASTLAFQSNGLLSGLPSSFNMSSSYCTGNSARNIAISQVGIISKSKMSC